MKCVGNKKAGLTLVELMVSMGVLALLSMGILSSVMQTRRMTEDSIHLSTATAAAQGYIEQIKNMDFDSLDDEILPTLVNQGDADPLTVSAMVDDPEVGADTDVLNTKLIDLDNTPGNTSDDMRMDVVLYVENITSDANQISNARRIVVRYTYTYTDANRTHRYTNTLSTVRSEVPTF